MSLPGNIDEGRREEEEEEEEEEEDEQTVLSKRPVHGKGSQTGARSEGISAQLNRAEPGGQIFTEVISRNPYVRFRLILPIALPVAEAAGVTKGEPPFVDESPQTVFCEGLYERTNEKPCD